MFQKAEIQGLREFRLALRAMDPQWPRELSRAAKDAAAVVANAAKARADSLGGVARRVSPTIRAGGSARGATVTLGNARHPEALGAEFGGGKYVKGRPSPAGGYTSQFPAWRGSDSSAGYFLWPSIREHSDDVRTSFERSIDRITARAFPD